MEPHDVGLSQLADSRNTATGHQQGLPHQLVLLQPGHGMPHLLNTESINHRRTSSQVHSTQLSLYDVQLETIADAGVQAGAVSP